ncbi:MAG: Winged helix DNA-binding domain [Myxococcaceae bacterium]|nr:Winged helix DNA-binding domain [Myxococcaceae bacterium]MEA2750350.1 Winged helix DNA-binding domain [Myxococcales bacterium]
MHPLMFQFKRAHLCALAGARALSYKTGLTPARHDLLRCIEGFGVPYVEGQFEEYQSRLWRALGISRTSASKMVRRLIELGLAQRRRAPRDRRTFLVSLTKEGKRRMRRAFLILLRRKPFQRRFERAFGERTWTAHHAVKNLTFAVERVARHLRDTSWPVYLTAETPDDPIDDIDVDDWIPADDPDRPDDPKDANAVDDDEALTPPAAR